MILGKIKIVAAVAVVIIIFSSLGYLAYKENKELYNIEHSHYLVTDLSTGKSWESISKPRNVGSNITFKTSDDTGIIIHGSVSIKRIK